MRILATMEISHLHIIGKLLPFEFQTLKELNFQISYELKSNHLYQVLERVLKFRKPMGYKVSKYLNSLLLPLRSSWVQDSRMKILTILALVSLVPSVVCVNPNRRRRIQSLLQQHKSRPDITQGNPFKHQ